MLERTKIDLNAVLERDPAARSRWMVVLTYPGFHALLFHRLANAAWLRDWYLLGRIVSHIGRLLTGIEIHPGATIGRGVFIDHGMGVVIGETAELGDNVTLYQGVTLGGTRLHEGKRHPTLEEGVIVGAGAKVLGPLTIGRDARIGSNSVVVKDVPPGTTVVGVPAKAVRGSAKSDSRDFDAYGTPDGSQPDPVAHVMNGLLDRVQILSARIEELEQRLAEQGVISPPGNAGITRVEKDAKDDAETQDP
ncbi:MAG: serine O-acetyltransferase [Rhodospirillales bacterium]|nr:serine O-acetyltransferase [Rhodospirillales bacterium]